MLEWKDEVAAFFDLRAEEVGSRRRSREYLCYVSGRDPRLWSDRTLYDDMIHSICDQLAVTRADTVVEIGCAGGFLMQGLAPQSGRYIGVDLSIKALGLARSLSTGLSAFVHGDGLQLPFKDATVDRALSYDVFTNIPDIDVASRIVREMVRIIKPGGRVLIGSLADEKHAAEYVVRVQQVTNELEERYGPQVYPRRRWEALKKWWPWAEVSPKPSISCYYYQKELFNALGERLGIGTRIADIHAGNPYHGYRFNVIYTKPLHAN